VRRDGEDFHASRAQRVFNLAVLGGDERQRHATLSLRNHLLDGTHSDAHEFLRERLRFPQVSAVVLDERLLLLLEDGREGLARGGGAAHDGAQPERGVVHEV
jgi:hypothetical protein